MLDRFRADLHVHTCLSPCASLDMTPARIIDRAGEAGLDIVAITDHNSAENAGPALRLARERGILVIPGMEVTTSEEVHILALFPSEEPLHELQAMVYYGLPEREGRVPEFEQVIVNEFDEVEGFNRKNLIAATTLTLDDSVREIGRLGGIAIASHIDREVFGIISQMGFIPPGTAFDALEISPSADLERTRALFSEYSCFPWVRSSDAHHLADIGRRWTEFLIREPSFEELRMALRGEGERGLRIV